MSDFLESESCLLPLQLRDDVAERLHEPKRVRTLELALKGETLEETQEFARMLIALKKKGVRISHEVSIKLDFPQSISRDQALSLIEKMPKPGKGSIKVRLQTEQEKS